MASSSGDVLPTGCRILTSIPDVFFIPEFVFGGLVWTLVASTRITLPNPLAWVMFVSVFCFVMTTAWIFIFLCGANRSSTWPALDAGYHFVAVLFYLSASVILAFITILQANITGIITTNDNLFIYRLDISAVVMSFMATFFYFLHAIFSAIRWKRF